ncbi:PKD domain-containing protein, partial [bacterium]|nr:PKD domain-containing protein [bacterium]
INIADLSPIGTNFGRRVEKYNVYRTLSIADLPAGNAEPAGSGAELLGSVAHAAAEGTASQGQLRFSFVLDNAAPGWFYFVRPADANTEGTPSNIVSFGAQGGNLSPVASFTADPTSGDAPLSVSFDASASSDPDGLNGDITDIVQFQWDFEGDGIVDETGSSPTTQHTYLQPGQFGATLLVFDSGAGFAVSSAEIVIGQAGNVAPLASLTAQPLSGQAPLPVQFDASASTDDGGIGNLTFEWDFNGDGSFDLSTGSNPQATNLYAIDGAFEATVRVSDSGALSDTASVSIAVEPESLNLSPLAALQASSTFGIVPLSVDFTFVGSTDPDGELVSLEMDFDGDGFTDAAAASADKTISHVYTDAGQFKATLTVLDDRGGSATDQVVIFVNEIGNQSPGASASFSPDSGDAPLEVGFDGSNSSDADGTIVNFAWDFDNDGVDDLSGPDAVVQHTYTNGGTFSFKLTVTDDKGGTGTISKLNAITVTNPANIPPIADLDVQVLDSGFPLLASLDPSGSSDPDGNIVLFEYDFDGDGDFEFSTTEATAQQFSYPSIGSFTPVLRVTDNDAVSATDTDSTLLVSTGWSSVAVSSVSKPGSTDVALISSGATGLKKRFVACYTDLDKGPLLSVNANPATPTVWSLPVVAAPSSNSACSILAVEKAPAVFFSLPGGTGTGGIGYVRSQDGQGDVWNAVVAASIDGAGISAFLSAMIANGRPAVMGFRGLAEEAQFFRATDATGSGFDAAVPVFFGEFEEPLGVRAVLSDGRPAMLMLTGSSEDVRFKAALNTNGSFWPEEAQIVDEACSGFRQNLVGAAASTVSGLPMVVYRDDVAAGDGLSIALAQNTEGSIWVINEDILDLPQLDDVRITGIDLDVLNDRPVVVFRYARQFQVPGSLTFIQQGSLAFAIADDASAITWSPVEVIDGLGRPGLSAAIAHNGSTFVVSHFDAESGELRIASRPTSL